MTNDKSLSLVIPCYNSSELLRKELPLMMDYLAAHLPDFEIILVDDGSKDGEQVKALALRYGCHYLQQLHNKGKGAALRLGFAAAKGKVQLFTDSDFPFEPDAIVTMFRYLQSGEADIVIGDRTAPTSVYYLEVSRTRKIGSYLISGFGKRLLRNDIIDTQCGLKGFSAGAANQLFPYTISNRFGIDFELLYLASKTGLVIKKVPVRLRTSYPSTVRIVADGIRILTEIYQALKHHGNHKQTRG